MHRRRNLELSRGYDGRYRGGSSRSMLKHVFISYRHESPEHSRAVRRLGELLRQADLPVALDQFFLDEHPGGPDSGGWPKWCEDNANESACVVIVPSEGWFAAYDKRAPRGIGLGAATEADLFRQALYDDAGENARIRLAFLHALDPDHVPQRLKAWHQFRPFDADHELNQLIRWIADRLGLQGIEPPTVRWPAPVEFEPDLADRTAEWPAVVDLLAGRSRERILLIQGGTGLGKSALVRQAAVYAKQIGLPVVRVDFKAVPDVAGVLGQFDLDLGERLPNFSREGAGKTHLLRKDLRALRQPALLIFDSYDRHVLDNKPVADWFNQHLLAEVETALALAVIVAGQERPNLAGAGWHELARRMPLDPITEPAAWESWIHRRYPAFRAKGAHLPTVLMAAGGNPALVSTLCDGIARS